MNITDLIKNKTLVLIIIIILYYSLINQKKETFKNNDNFKAKFFNLLKHYKKLKDKIYNNEHFYNNVNDDYKNKFFSLLNKYKKLKLKVGNLNK